MTGGRGLAMTVGKEATRNDNRKGGRNDTGIEKRLAMTRRGTAPVRNTDEAGCTN